jgi:hypothetical protein
MQEVSGSIPLGSTIFLRSPLHFVSRWIALKAAGSLTSQTLSAPATPRPGTLTINRSFLL